MNKRSKAAKKWGIERLKRIRSAPEVVRVEREYGLSLSQRSEETWYGELICTCLLRAAGKLTERMYRADVVKAALQSGIPMRDMKILADLHVAFAQAALVGTGEFSDLMRGMVYDV